MYELPKLPYLYQDLEPFIDTHTVGLHYHKHQKNYLNQLNKLLNQIGYDYKYSLDDLIYHINEFPKELQKDILYNLGGVINHNLYFKSMNPYRKQKPIGLFKTYLDKKYENYDNFVKKFKEMALKIKGSGYTFLVLKDNDLEIINVPNQETPLSIGYIPLFNVDMWEHAYYLNYKNEKEKYLDNFFLVADFSNASEIFNKSLK